MAKKSNEVQALARMSRPVDADTLRARALHDARGMILREGCTYRVDRITPWLLCRSVAGRTNQVDLVIANQVWRTGARRTADKAIRRGKWRTIYA
jgi:hypothetical protein